MPQPVAATWVCRGVILAAVAALLTSLAPAQVTAVDLEPSVVFVRTGTSQALRVKIRPDRYSARDLRWWAQDPSIAQVDSMGDVTGRRAGETYVLVRGAEDGTATDMCRVIAYDDSNSMRFGAEAASAEPGGLRFTLEVPRDDVVAVVCRLRNAAAAQAQATLQIDGGSALRLTVPAGGRPTDLSPRFAYDFAGTYRFGLTAGRHTLRLGLPSGVTADEVRLIGETGAHDHFESHQSAVLGGRRWYRIFLPPDYAATRDRLPVLYYLHGWGGRVFKEGVPGSHIDLGELARRVAREHVIVVASDGQVSWDADEHITRYAPYNLFLPHDAPVLWEEYFPELVQHIDSRYRTLASRSGRALLGFSMGGLMSYRIGERFPDLVGSINPCCASNEGFFGPQQDLTYVRISDYAENLLGVRLRIHDTQRDYLEPGNARVWQAVQRAELPGAAWALFAGTHQIDPAGDSAAFDQAFDWAVDSFRHPAPPPERWHVLEFVPHFNVWGYQVDCLPARAGLTELHGVTRGGFRVSTLSALPDGGPRPQAAVDVATAAIYKADSLYEISDYDEAREMLAIHMARSDPSGRIHLAFDGGTHQVGVHRPGDPPEVVVLRGSAGMRPFLPVGREALLTIKLYNRGATTAHDLRGIVSSPESGVAIARPDFVIAALAPGQKAEVAIPVVARVQAPAYAAPFSLRFDVTVRSAAGEGWRDELDVVPFFDPPKVDAVLEHEGANLVLKAAGRPLRVFSDDPCLVKIGDVPLIEPGNPEDAGMYSLLSIAPGTTPGHVVRCLVRSEAVVPGECAVAVRWGSASVLCP